MAVVKNPSENRLAMAKPPPKKLDPQTADKINAERKKGWNSECLSRQISIDSVTYILLALTNAQGLFMDLNVQRIGQRWLAKTRTK